jgi:hypothetical protein
MSPIAAISAQAVTALTPGIVSSRRISAEASASEAIAWSTNPISSSRTSMWRRQPSTVSRSSAGSSSRASQARPRTPKTSLIGGLPTSRRISTACT